MGTGCSLSKGTGVEGTENMAGERQVLGGQGRDF